MPLPNHPCPSCTLRAGRGTVLPSVGCGGGQGGCGGWGVRIVFRWPVLQHFPALFHDIILLLITCLIYQAWVSQVGVLVHPPLAWCVGGLFGDSDALGWSPGMFRYGKHPFLICSLIFWC
jgi:hypothetical protein